ncbi:MAG: hypothetical protein ACYDCS_08340 [Candidatus Dormibacteria bacterium]
MAAARAGRFVTDPADTRARTAPPHPAFAAFRKMSYVWVDGQAFEPIGDSLDHWLTYLGENGARQAWIDVTGGDEVCRVIRRDGAENWRTVWNGGIFMLHGSEETGPPRHRETDVPGMAQRLHDAVQAEMEAGVTDVRRAALGRALEILASPGDGAEVSDVAWPSFVLPDGSPSASRRLIAAASAAWPETPAAADPDAQPARGEGCVDAALDAIAAAVNSSATAEPVE